MLFTDTRELERQLEEAGNKLLQLPHSVDEILSLLDQVENYLSRVEQSPSKSMHTALSPSRKALVADELLRHRDADVKVAVASCISEITRITAPYAPYDDDQMKEIFQLIVWSFENLSDKSSRSYNKRTLILETVATVKSCLVMLHLECDGLIVEMFQHFLKAIRDYHSGNVFFSMKTIMTLVLEESGDISLELISPILASLKSENQGVPAIARKLAERVVENSAIKLKPCLKQAMKSLRLSLDDYNKVIASICNARTDADERNDRNTCGEQSASDTVVYGRNLVDSKVKVWWPYEEKFYEGVIVSYDPVRKKHKVSYTDGDEEVLNLRQEKWEFVGDDSMPDAEQAAECRSPDPFHEMQKKKRPKTNSEPSRKQVQKEGSRGGGASSSKSKGADAKSDRKSRVDAKFLDNKAGDKTEDARDGKFEYLSKNARRQSNADGFTADGKSKDDGGTAKTGSKPKLGNPEEYGRDNNQGVEEEFEEGGEEVGLVEGQEGFGNVNVGPTVESLVPNLASSSVQEETNECDSAPWTSERETLCGPRTWREGDFEVSCVPNGSVIVTLKTKEKIKLSPGALFAEVREENRPLLSDIFLQWPSTFVRLGNVSAISRKFALDSLVSFVEVLENVSLPNATPKDFESVCDGLDTLVRYRLEVDWLRKRIDQMVSLLELPVVRNRLEKASKELEEVEVVAMRLKDKKKGLEGRVAELESVSSGRFDMSSHAGQGLRR